MAGKKKPSHKSGHRSGSDKDAMAQFELSLMRAADEQADMGLSSFAQQLGFVVYLNEEEEFLAEIKDTATQIQREFTDTPAGALIFSTEAEAVKAGEVMKHKHSVSICVLFDDDDELVIAEEVQLS